MCMVTVRCTPADRERWKLAATLGGVTLNQFCRSTLAATVDAIEAKHGPLAELLTPPTGDEVLAALETRQRQPRKQTKTPGPAARPQTTPSEQRPAPSSNPDG